MFVVLCCDITPGKGSFWKEGLVLTLSLRGHGPVTMGKAWQWESEAADRVASTVREHRDASSTCGPLLIHPGAPTRSVVLSLGVATPLGSNGLFTEVT